MTDDREHITSSSITERSVRPERSGADGRCRSEIFTVDLAGMLIMVGAGGADRAVRNGRCGRSGAGGAAGGADGAGGAVRFFKHMVRVVEFSRGKKV